VDCSVGKTCAAGASPMRPLAAENWHALCSCQATFLSNILHLTRRHCSTGPRKGNVENDLLAIVDVINNPNDTLGHIRVMLRLWVSLISGSRRNGANWV